MISDMRPPANLADIKFVASHHEFFRIDMMLRFMTTNELIAAWFNCMTDGSIDNSIGSPDLQIVNYFSRCLLEAQGAIISGESGA